MKIRATENDVRKRDDRRIECAICQAMSRVNAPLASGLRRAMTTIRVNPC